MFLRCLILALGVVSAFGEQFQSIDRRLQAYSHNFKHHELIPLYANKVGPLHNPSETYQYYDLPFCRPNELRHKPEGLGEVVDGNRLITTPYALPFLQDQELEPLCVRELTKEDLEKFRKAIRDYYILQMFYDDLPMWGSVGALEHVVTNDGPKAKYWLNTHYLFEISYHYNNVIEATLHTPEKYRVDISDTGKPISVEFTYSVRWVKTDVTFANRMDKYRKYQVSHLQIHWFSIINSCVTVILLTGFLATILMRVLKNDFVKYTMDEEEDGEASGWKLLHGDVFRVPPYNNLFCAFIGTGTQMLALSVFVFLLGLVGTFYPHNRGAVYTALIVLYAATACIAGYIASLYYKQLGGKEWVRNIMLTSFIFCGPLFLVFCFNNTLAIIYETTAALPFGTIVVLLVIWALVTIPLTVAGGVVGKNSKEDFYAPVRTSKYVREVPTMPWYKTTVPQMLIAGFLPFSAIYIELYYVLVSMWGHKLYTPPYSILCIMFLILVLVTAFITIALTYFQLAAEDHRWWWRSFLCGGSTGMFIYGYCFYFYFARSDMSGFYQAAFFFGYMAMLCLAFFIMLGTVGWRASLMFVRHIYKAVKCE